MTHSAEVLIPFAKKLPPIKITSLVEELISLGEELAPCGKCHPQLKGSPLTIKLNSREV